MNIHIFVCVCLYVCLSACVYLCRSFICIEFLNNAYYAMYAFITCSISHIPWTKANRKF